MEKHEQEFRDTITRFVNNFKDSGDEAKIKSEYVKLVKEFHPDVNRNIENKLANEYMMTINYVYERLLRKKKIALKPAGGHEENRVNGKYCFINEEGVKEYLSEKTVYIYKLGKREYDRAVVKSMKPMGRDTDGEGYEIIGHLYKSYKYFQEVINMDRGGIWGRAAEESLNRAFEMNNRIARGLSKTGSTGLAWAL
jgi:curved DNA-binding protein CbpA